MNSLPPVLAVADVAELLRCAKTTVEEYARRGELPGLKFGEGWIFPAGALLKRLDELALLQAEQRRGAMKPLAELHPVPTSGRRRRPLPQLPPLKELCAP